MGIKFIPNIQAIWLGVHDRAIDAKAYVNELRTKDDRLILTFPADALKAEELNCVMLGLDYKVILNRVMATRLTVKPKNTSGNKLYNYTGLDYTVDLSSDMLAYLHKEEKSLEIVDRITGLNQIIVNQDNTVDCSSNLIGKGIIIDTHVIYKRWVENLMINKFSGDRLPVIEGLDLNKLEDRPKTYKPLTHAHIYFLNQEFVQVLWGRIVPVKPVNNTYEGVLRSPTRVITFDRIQQVKIQELSWQSRSSA